MTAIAAGEVSSRAESSVSYRWNQRWLCTAMSYIEVLETPDWSKLSSVLDERQFAIEMLSGRFQLHVRRDQPTSAIREYCASTIHLHCNRYFRVGCAWPRQGSWDSCREHSKLCCAARRRVGRIPRGHLPSDRQRVNGQVAESECA